MQYRQFWLVMVHVVVWCTSKSALRVWNHNKVLQPRQVYSYHSDSEQNIGPFSPVQARSAQNRSPVRGKIKLKDCGLSHLGYWLAAGQGLRSDQCSNHKLQVKLRARTKFLIYQTQLGIRSVLRTHWMQGTQKRRRLSLDATPAHLTQGLFLPMSNLLFFQGQSIISITLSK